MGTASTGCSLPQGPLWVPLVGYRLKAPLVLHRSRSFVNYRDDEYYDLPDPPRFKSLLTCFVLGAFVFEAPGKPFVLVVPGCAPRILGFIGGGFHLTN